MTGSQKEIQSSDMADEDIDYLELLKHIIESVSTLKNSVNYLLMRTNRIEDRLNIPVVKKENKDA